MSLPRIDDAAVIVRRQRTLADPTQIIDQVIRVAPAHEAARDAGLPGREAQAQGFPVGGLEASGCAPARKPFAVVALGVVGIGARDGGPRIDRRVAA